MFSDDIIASDAFLDMPSESQLLYFHLGMNADDDGFIGSPKMIMRIIGASDDSYKLLLHKKFVLHFESGICVVKHWRMNNQIRKDRYTETKYLAEKETLFIKENGAYTLDENKGVKLLKGHINTDDLDFGNQTATNGQPSIGKDSIGKDSIGKSNTAISKKSKLNEEYETSFQEFWTIYPEKVAKGKAYETWKLISDEVKQLCITAIKNQVENNHFYKEWKKEDNPPHPTTWLNQRRWEDTVKKIIKTEEIKVVKI